MRVPRVFALSVAALLVTGLAAPTLSAQFKVPTRPYTPPKLPGPLGVGGLEPLNQPDFTRPPGGSSTVVKPNLSNSGQTTGTSARPPVAKVRPDASTKHDEQRKQSFPVTGGPPPKAHEAGGDGDGDDGDAADKSAPDSQLDQDDDDSLWKRTKDAVTNWVARQAVWISEQPGWLLVTIGASVFLVLVVVAKMFD